MQHSHLQMIAIGASIGTGLFLASGSTIANAGALGALVAYLIAGLVLCFFLTSRMQAHVFSLLSIRWEKWQL